MSRRSTKLYVKWKVSPPADIAGKIEHMLFDNVHGKPRYGARNRLIAELLRAWVDVQEGRPPRSVPSLEDLLLERNS